MALITSDCARIRWRGSDNSSGDSEKYDTDQELKDLFAEVDTDGSGSIDWDEFIMVIGTKLKEKKRTVEELKDINRKPVSMVRNMDYPPTRWP